jgi:hypothetical protein
MVLRAPLRYLHPDSSFSRPKLDQLEKLTTEIIIWSLRPGQEGSLKVRPTGTILDGNHRIKILESRGIDVNSLEREIIYRTEIP